MEPPLELQQTNKPNPIQQSPSWEANSSSARHKIPRILCNPKVHYRAHNSPPLFSILSEINGIHTPILFLEHHLNFHIRTVQHLDIIKVYYPPTDAQVSCLKKQH
jgi:hypothetical protein